MKALAVTLSIGILVTLLPASPAAAQSASWVKEARVYYLGDASAADRLRAAIDHVTLVSEQDVAGFAWSDKWAGGRGRGWAPTAVLIADGAWVTEPGLLAAPMQAGMPVVVLGDTSVAKNLFEGQISTRAVATTEDGLEHEETGYGYLLTPAGVQIEWMSTRTDPQEIAEAGYEWALDAILQARFETRRSTFDADKAASWIWITQKNYDGVHGSYGKNNVRSDLYWLSNDNSSTYSWWDIRFRHQSVPGKLLYGNDWRTDNMWQWVDADSHNGSYFLTQYSPTSTSGSSTVGVSIGVTAGQSGASVSASQSWSYSISDVVVSDYSDYSTDLASWQHKVNENANVGQNSYQCEPGATIRVPQGGSGNNWRECYKVEWVDPGFWGDDHASHQVCFAP